jgi:hypothetical protein
MPNITARNVSDIMIWSVPIPKKAGLFSLIPSAAAILKNAKTAVASFACLGSLARYCARRRRAGAVRVP